MITVSGVAKLKVRYSVQLGMTEEEFESMSEKQQNETIENQVDWHTTCRSAEIDDIEIDEVIQDEEA